LLFKALGFFPHLNGDGGRCPYKGLTSHLKNKKVKYIPVWEKIERMYKNYMVKA
jgi:hypothetical protein